MGAEGAAPRAMGADGASARGEVAHSAVMAAVDEMLQNRYLLGGGLSVPEMRKALSARGIAHEHCLERALMRS